MPIEGFDRSHLRLHPLKSRVNRAHIASDHVAPGSEAGAVSDSQGRVLEEIVARLKAARDAGTARMLTFGAHTIKNGLSPVLIRLIEDGWFTHLATNGAGIIHDWEFAYLGETSEHVAANVAEGTFGAWEETGFYINLALRVGAFRGLGYGESVGAMVENEGIDIPSEGALQEALGGAGERPCIAAAACDLLGLLAGGRVAPGVMAIPHPHKAYGLQAAAFRLGVPFTGHPMFGHDIIYIHPMNSGAAVGITAERDFLRFAKSVSQLEGGVYLSIGSAVMSPMIFEKSLSMAQNLALQSGPAMTNHFMGIVDLAESHWDWSQGEPPEDNPDYYLRYNKTFSRMGGTMRYLSMDNRDFLLALQERLG